MELQFDTKTTTTSLNQQPVSAHYRRAVTASPTNDINSSQAIAYEVAVPSDIANPLWGRDVSTKEEKEKEKEKEKEDEITPYNDTFDNQRELAEFFLQHSYDVNVVHPLSGDTVLHYALRTRDVVMIETLLRQGANTCIANNRGETPLHIAMTVPGLDSEVIVWLLKAGAQEDINAHSNNGETPLHIAAREGNVEAMKVLLAYGTKLNRTNERGNTALHEAAERGHQQIVVLLLETKAEVNTKNFIGSTPLHYAAANGNVEIVRALIKKGARVNTVNKMRMTALHVAVQLGHLEVVKKLIKHGANPDILDNEGKSAWDYAVEEGRATIIEYGLEMLREKIEEVQIIGLLHSAVDENQLEVFRVLLREGVRGREYINVSYNTNRVLRYNSYRVRCSLVYIAAMIGHMEIMQELIRGGADINARDRKGRTPLHYAVKRGYIEMAQELIREGANINAQDIKGRTPLYYAARKGNIRIAQELIRKGADINIQDRDGRTPLHYISSGGHVEFAGCYDKVPLRDDEMEGHVEIMQELIRMGADINARDRNGNTPLHDAVMNECLLLVEAFVKNNANVNIQNDNNKTALNLAMEKGYLKAVSILAQSEHLDSSIKGKIMLYLSLGGSVIMSVKDFLRENF